MHVENCSDTVPPPRPSCPLPIFYGGYDCSNVRNGMQSLGAGYIFIIVMFPRPLCNRPSRTLIVDLATRRSI